MNKISPIFFLLSFFFHLLFAQENSQRNYLFENISILEGLSSPEVQYIYQDKNGYLWISTPDGLNRYDGYSIKTFKNDPADSTSLPGNYCGAITEDGEGYLWIGILGNTIARFDPKNEKFKHYSVDAANLTRLSEQLAALTDSKGNVWFTTTNYGVQRYNRTRDKFESIKLDSIENPGSQWGQVYDIIELKNGNILVCDYASNVKIYNPDRNLFQTYFIKTNYSPQSIVKLYEDISGNIWFAGEGTLMEYSPVYFTIENFDLKTLIQHQYPDMKLEYDYISGIEQDDDGFLWLSIFSDGLMRLDTQTKEIRRFNFSSTKSNMGQEIIWRLFKDKYGVFWIGSWFNGLTKFDPLREPFNYTNITQDKGVNSTISTVTVISGSRKDEDILFGTAANGLFSYNLATKETFNLNNKLKLSAGQDRILNIQGLLADENDNIWFSYNGQGLSKYAGDKVTSIESPHLGKTTAYIINDMKMDLSGKLWLASRYGFEILNPATNKFSLLPTIMTKKMSKGFRKDLGEIIQSREPIESILKVSEASNLEKSFILDEDKKVMLVCIGEGRISNGNNGLFDTGSLQSADRKNIWSMNKVSETFNVGGGFKNRIAVKCLDLKKGDYKLTFVSDVGHSYANWNVIPPTDSLWWGIQVLEINDAEFKKIQSMNQKEINAQQYLPMEIGNSIEISKKFYNIIWLGSFSNGFFKYDMVSGDFKQYSLSDNRFSPDNRVPFIYEDKEGIVWLATQKNMLRFDPVTEKIEKFAQKDGLPSNIINSIVEDMQGNLWISTAAGLSKFNKNAPKEKWNFVNFDTKDGLQKYSSSKASWITENGEIILGANDGLISFFPGKINVIQPDIILEDIKISNISLKTDSAVVKIDKAIPKLENLELSYQQNNISFEFASLHFSRPAKNKLMYQLQGFTNNWMTTDRNFASFTNLDPGEYVFRIKGSNGDGIWNEEGRELIFNIMPPWWQTTFAYIMYVLLFAGIIFGINRIQRRRLLAKARAANAIKEAELRAQLAESENERKSQELEEARQLQLSMLPKELPQLPNLDIGVYMLTATEVGGDYYDFHVELDGTLTVVIGDATGHGMRAGTMVTTVKSLFKSHASNPDILFSFQEISRCIKQMNFGKLSMCMTMLKIKGNKMQISTAGMPPSLIFRRDSRVVEEHLFKAMPLGTMEKFPYEIKDTTLKAGDTILLMSDGLPELENTEGKMYGYKKIRNGFEDVAEKSPEDIISFLKNEGASWVNNADPDDDVTFVVIKVK